MEFAVANETDVTHLNGRELSRIRLPQCVAKRRIRDCELIAKSVTVSHSDLRDCQWTGETKPINVSLPVLQLSLQDCYTASIG